MNRALVIAVLVFAAGCAGTGGESGANCAALAAGRYCLQPSTGVAPFDATQMIRLRIGDRRETLIAELEVDAGGLRLVGLTPFGQKLIQLNYDNRSVQSSTPPGARFDPVFLAATLQLAHWPAAAVRAGLSAPLALEEGAGTRRVLSNGTPVVSIRLDGEQPPYHAVRMTVHPADMEMEADTLAPGSPK
jgi:hypothetical protein